MTSEWYAKNDHDAQTDWSGRVFKEYAESKFLEGMTWENRSDWHLDLQKMENQGGHDPSASAVLSVLSKQVVVFVLVHLFGLFSNSNTRF